MSQEFICHLVVFVYFRLLQFADAIRLRASSAQVRRPATGENKGDVGFRPLQSRHSTSSAVSAIVCVIRSDALRGEYGDKGWHCSTSWSCLICILPRPVVCAWRGDLKVRLVFLGVHVERACRRVPEADLGIRRWRAFRWTCLTWGGGLLGGIPTPPTRWHLQYGMESNRVSVPASTIGGLKGLRVLGDVANGKGGTGEAVETDRSPAAPNWSCAWRSLDKRDI
eukprot:Gregarina_sp_Poly_1__5059@NODE_2681_length_1832_cov_16_486686_g1702_i0_p2_GENE_NODE_2681_length_1832_cov_16_486686_g1702_i0NODE_2681_length_1832_cov_16_486686_g1702_i0_p2_ORF_typecomplete_len224_score12_84DUF3331/PF11811_8/1_9e03DUF3331/PF11811_8/0_41PSI/PF01437_25/0_36PSI/PF01437_25/2_9e02_NODE_2681_length_1832_cov_16_486686_g1702_i010241695